MPPLRLAVIDDVAANPRSTPSDTRRRTGKPWTTIDRAMQALHMLGVLDVEEDEDVIGGKLVTRWRYSLAEGIDPRSLEPNPSPDCATRLCDDNANDADTHTDETMGGAKPGEGQDPPPDPPRCRICGRPLVWPDAQQRGTCSGCSPLT
jgi:hypothetical protein